MDQQMSFGRALFLLYGDERGFTEKQCTEIAEIVRKATIRSCADYLRDQADDLSDRHPDIQGMMLYSVKKLEAMR